MHSRVLAIPATTLIVASLALTGCSSTSGKKGGGTGSTSVANTPQARLAAAKKVVDSTSGFTIKVTSANVPKTASGLLSADGAGTHAPAFKGSIKAQVGGLSADVPIIATGGKTYAILPFQKTYKAINPKDYGAPDPAQLFSTTNGLSSLLVKVTGPRFAAKKRSGADIVQSIKGTVSGADVKQLLLMGDGTGSYQADYGITDNNEARTMTLTGPFFKGATNTSYTIQLTKYGTQVEITAP
ncbi:LppX_LprAFG lipoprotein [Calidifontibacter sp. DB0510]|uniref:LppX_LprAFG lipoprotein n=1 Tax=Metallococcus carri TaxID=1656884 RepID=A0A967B951_9MICO|nr:LppX_LprAFG lipoprotein [Metallococcus carri]NHN57116.1 LppX_LprAFG lipoprotein [Metallococcus carri]NOP39015.1 LppX_LprAFG lipoprotein [Calidifontibacter sp. DB2511S]